MPKNLFCVVYRTGGTVNFKWNRSVAVDSKEAAEAVALTVERMGYPAKIVDYHLSMSIGLPETFYFGESRARRSAV